MSDIKALREAANSNDTSEMRRLLKQDPELVEDWKCLLDACYRGQSEIVEVLLQHSANPNVVSKTAHRHRPLHRVIEHKKTRPTHYGHLRCVQILLEGGADPLARGTFQQVTPLQLAAMGGETQFISALKSVTKRLDIFHHCVLGDHRSVARILKRDSELALAEDANGWKPMMYVAASRLHWSDAKASNSLVKCAEMLIEAGAEANPIAKWENWPLPALYYATGVGNHPALARLMLDHGADPNDGESLHHSAENVYTECLDLLMEHGGDLNICANTDYSSPLYFILANTSTQGVEWLLDHGADPNLKNGPYGRTALHAAASRGCSDKMLELLIQNGAEIQAKDKNGDTPIDLAKGKKKTRVVEYLETQV